MMQILALTAVVSDAPQHTRERQCADMLKALDTHEPVILNTRHASVAFVARSSSGQMISARAAADAGVCQHDGPADRIRILIADSARLHEDCSLDHLHNEHFALLALHAHQASLFRSLCGHQSLFYQRFENQWLIASDERCLLLSDRPYTLNRHRIACHLGIENPQPQSTFFNEISQTVPMHVVHLEGSTVRQQRFVWFQPDADVQRMSEADAADELGRLMDQSVHRVLRSVDGTNGAIGLAVSGGMDSTAIAGSLGPDACRVAGYSWDFADFPQGNEHAYTDTLGPLMAAKVQRVTIEQPEPLGDAFMALANSVCAPFIDPYRVLRHQLASRLQQDGIDTLLTGDFGDHLYLGQHYHLRDALRARMPGILSAIRRRIHLRGLKGFRDQDYLRRLLPFNGWSRRFRRRQIAWLRPSANQELFSRRDAMCYLNPLKQADRYEACLSVNAAEAARFGQLIHRDWGIDQRYPLREPELIRFVLSLPAHYLTHPLTDQSKWLMRQTMRQRLPSSIVERKGKTTFASIFMHGINQHRSRAEELVYTDHACWTNYIDPDWIVPPLEQWSFSERQLMVLWQMISLELWIVSLPANIAT